MAEMSESARLRWAADFLARVRGDEDEYEPEYVRGWDEAVALLRELAEKVEADKRKAPPDSSNYPPVTSGDAHA